MRDGAESQERESWGKRSMQHVASVMALETAMKIVAKGFPNGVIFTCATCGNNEAADVEETARAMMEGWPRRMIITEGNENATNISSTVCG